MVIKINNPDPPTADVIAVDIETSGLDQHSDRLLSIALNDGTDTWIYLDFYGFDLVRPLIEDANKLKLIQNAKFEALWFKKLGWTLRNIHDTLLAERVLAKDKMPMGLEDIVGRRVGVLSTKDVRETFYEHPGFALRPVTNEQITYMKNDVAYLHMIWQQQIAEAQEKDLVPTINLENKVVLAVADLEYHGLRLDVDLWLEQKAEYERLSKKADEDMRALIGEFSILVERKKKGETYIAEVPTQQINLNSWQQLLPTLNQRFNANAPNTKAETLKEYAKQENELGRFCRLLLKHKSWRKRIGFDYDKYVSAVTGKAHPTYHQLGARTGRFSCSKPNMQQVPRPIKGEPNMRNLWTADCEDFVIIRADYSQQEPRVMAQLSGDKAMIQACNAQDVYVEFGKYAYGETITHDDPRRHLMKTFVLAVGYGAGLDKLETQSGLPKKECAGIRQSIRDTFPTMVNFGNRMHRQVAQYGYVTTALGRRRYLPNSFTQAVNTPVQGTAADMFKLALVKIHDALTDMKSCGKISPNTRVWNLVHDEIEVHCRKDEVDIVLPLVKKLMEDAGKELCPDVLHVAEAEYGYRWDK